MNEQLLNIIMDAKTILNNKYWSAKQANASTSMYTTFIAVQRLGEQAPVKKIAKLRRFIDENLQWLQK